MKLTHAILNARDAVGTMGRLARERVQSGAIFNPVRPANIADPYPFYAEFRTRRPLHRCYGGRGWVLSRYRDVEAVLSDRRFGADDRVASAYARNRASAVRAGRIDPDREDEPSLLRLEGDAHTRLRGLVAKTFTPSAVKSWEPRIHAVVDACLDAIEGRADTDLIADLASPLPVMIIAEILGIPTADRDEFRGWSDAIVADMWESTPEVMRRARAADDALTSYLEGIVEKRRAEPRDDLISALLAVEEQGDRLALSELYSTVTLLLLAGNETTTNLIGNGMLALLRHPDQLERLRAEPERIDGAIEELLRYDSPVQMTTRFVLEDHDFRSVRFQAGQQIILLLGSANRDPEHFPDPDRLDIGRSIDRHLSFGLGRHFCLGSRLARLEARTAISKLVERQPGMKLATEKPPFRPNPVLRGLQRLPVRL